MREIMKFKKNNNHRYQNVSGSVFSTGLAGEVRLLDEAKFDDEMREVGTWCYEMFPVPQFEIYVQRETMANLTRLPSGALIEGYQNRFLGLDVIFTGVSEAALFELRWC